jgi:hypothetical protein
MNTSLCRIEFVGGPSDGLVLSDPHFTARHKLQMPAAPAFVPHGRRLCCRPSSYWSTAYRLTSRERAIESGRPTTCLRYDFTGYELFETQAKRERGHKRRPRRMAAVRTWFSNLRRKFVDFMLEPIDHPLKVQPEQASIRDTALRAGALRGT